MLLCYVVFVALTPGTAMEAGAPVPSDGQYVNKTSWPEVERDHAAVVSYLDNYVGDLVALLDETGISNDTIVFFASDNGTSITYCCSSDIVTHHRCTSVNVYVCIIIW